MGKSLRVVLDSNVFSDEHFEALAASRFLELVLDGRLTPVFPAVMMEETLRAYSGQGRESLLNRWLPFILRTRARFCVELSEIWRRELILKRGVGASEYLSLPFQQNLVQVLTTLAKDGTSTLLEEALPVWRLGDVQRKAIRSSILALRKHPLPTPARPLEQSVPQLQTTAASRLIGFVTPHKRLARDLLSRWQREKHKYPFFTQAVDDLVFQLVLPLVDHSAAVDANARPDLEILIHLLRADALVTNESRFMARAFDETWMPRGKRRYTSTEFADFLKQL